MRTAESVVLTLWPPGPEARITSMRRSFSSLILTSTSSASGITATVTAEVWMRPEPSVAGTRCTRCTPPSYLSRRVRAAPVDQRDHFLDSAEPGVAEAERLDLPSMAFGVAGVHAEQIAGEQRRLLAAGAGADLEDDVLVVVGIARREQHLELLFERAPSSSAASAARPWPARAGRRRRRRGSLVLGDFVGDAAILARIAPLRTAASAPWRAWRIRADCRSTPDR